MQSSRLQSLFGLILIQRLYFDSASMHYSCHVISVQNSLSLTLTLTLDSVLSFSLRVSRDILHLVSEDSLWRSHLNEILLIRRGLIVHPAPLI